MEELVLCFLFIMAGLVAMLLGHFSIIMWLAGIIYIFFLIGKQIIREKNIKQHNSENRARN
ncbi:hypothetical protein [Nitratiruptor tergarcus]|uniref:Uncharacterized protein n=1 Tax=Nitratiruptor tergarcus DSM 16512 TaxID=1069081 RepID=A0A1W1WTG4_9BACT|nr:hypothetical protein [Nitratiruptor tergarcus]SMC09594.1 hypothetical protein SAMN05660197_1411 [Nitratiruptor tergarcus DSM 16512]